MSNTYTLVNPHIIGDFTENVNAKNSLEAARKFYKSISSHFNNNVPNFYFTIQKGVQGSGKYYHFEVSENRENNEVSFSIQPYIVKNEKTAIKNLSDKKAKFVKQYGGKEYEKEKDKKKHKDDSDSDSSSSSEMYYKRVKTYQPNAPTMPLMYWWYDPFVYKIDKLFVPTFYSYVTPYVIIDLLP